MSAVGDDEPKAYELVKQPGFPTIRVGTRILIPIDGFQEWLKKNSHTADSLPKNQ